MKKTCLAFSAIVLAAHFSAAHAVEFKNAVVGQPIADRTLTIGKLSMQLPSGQWILAAKVQGMGGSQPNVPAPPQHTFAAIQTYNKTISAVVVFSAPAGSYIVSRWNNEPCKSETSFVVKSTLNQTMAMPECFVVANQSPGSFETSTPIYQDLARWAYGNGYAFPDPMVRVFYTKYHGGDYFRLNAYFAGGPGSVPAAEAWGREAVSSLSAMVTRSTAQGKLPELPAFATDPVSVQPVANNAQSAASNAPPSLAETRLRQLKSLLDSKLITPEEYEGKRKKIVDEM